MTKGSIDDLLEHAKLLAAEAARAGESDGELLTRFVDRRDDDAFSVLIRRHSGMVWGVCRRLLGHHDAEDAFQATFLVLARKASSVRPRDAVGAWLYGVAHRAACKLRASRLRRREEGEADRAVSDPTPDDLRPLLDRELARLPDRHRAVVLLCDLEGLTRQQAAVHIGVPEGTVAGWHARGRARLAARLARRGVIPAVALASASTVGADVPAAALILAFRAATSHATGGAVAVSPAVAELADGVSRAMLLSYLKPTFATAAVCAAVLMAGVWSLTPKSDTVVASEPPLVLKVMEPAQNDKKPVPAIPPKPQKQNPFLVDLEFSHDSSLVVVCGDKLRVFDVATGKSVRSFDTPLSRAVSFSPSQKTVFAAGSSDGTIRIFDATKAYQIKELKGHDGGVYSLAFDSFGKRLASTSERYEKKGVAGLGQFRLWDTESGKELHKVEVPGGTANGVAFSPDGSLVAYCKQPKGDDNTLTLELLRVEDGKTVSSVKLSTDGLKGTPFGKVTRFLPGGKKLLIGGGVCVPVSKEEAYPYEFACRTTGLLWSVELGDKPSTKLVEAPRQGYIHNLSLTPDGKRYAVGSESVPRGTPKVELREVDGNKVVWSADVGYAVSDLFGIRVSPDGKRVSFLRPPWAEVRLIDAADGNAVQTIKADD